MIRYKHAPGCFLALMGFLTVSPLSQAQEPQQPMVYEGTVGGLRFLEEGQPPAMIHATVVNSLATPRSTPRDCGKANCSGQPEHGPLRA